MTSPTLKRETKHIIIKLNLNGTLVRALIDTGSKLDLITENAAKMAGSRRQTLAKPIAVRLALRGKSLDRVIFRHFVNATLHNPKSGLAFDDVPLRIGHIDGDYKLIVGTNFLKQFNLFPSILHRLLHCNQTKININDY
ncbi:hypothetical protein PTTG_28979 [Puccinia triticina 1-1 BBBD Race 1]|uniref:Peptidase A2 domain-containing protein n=1 Tax=Puccinia triticina (isolate 1-1 / race 1 (BBBD)) TaxID=630390 RepID=A0A180G7T2_PUCT1|nr:hypothetical protein PTTG_28979 [Puccinia triticina 1-1 BBBD Race 1]